MYDIRQTTLSFLCATALLVAGGTALAQGGGPAMATPGDWPLHNLDLRNSRFSPLTQINTTTADKVTIKWTYELPKGANIGTATPLGVDGVMFLNSGSKLMALDAATGQLKWQTDVEPTLKSNGRGPAYGDGKIFAVGQDSLIAVDARSGKPVESFGKGGVATVIKDALDFKDPDKYPKDFDPEAVGYLIQSAPTYYNGTIYIGSAVADSLISGGLIVAVDAKTGRTKWVFRTVPQNPTDDGWELAKDTWSGPLRQGGGIWTQPSLDPELGLLYANVSNPSPNYDGSSRKGVNLFTNSVVALDLNTGKLKWHFQAIHHDIWDWDLMTGPTLFDITVDGKPVKGLASQAKTCYVYALNRQTGEPIFPIVETPVPTKTDLPGEQPWPTQPIPYSARYVPQQPFCATFPKISDPELAKLRRPSFHPWQVNEFVITSPGLLGGPNRGSSSFSPRTGFLYVTGKNDAWSIKTKPVGNSIKPGPGSPGHFQSIGEQGKMGVTPTQNIGAFNPATGELAWVKEFPGTTNGGNLVTAGDVLFQAILRDFLVLDARTGATLAKVALKAPMVTTPLTYEARGKQFVAIAQGNTVVAVGLP